MRKGACGSLMIVFVVWLLWMSGVCRSENSKRERNMQKKKNCVCSSLALPTGLFYMTAYDDEDDVKLLELGLHTNVIPHYAASPPPSPCIKCKMETTEMFTGKYYIII